MIQEEWHILITEDNKDDVIFLQEILSDNTFSSFSKKKIKSTFTSNMTEALKFLKAPPNLTKFDLILLDLNLPDSKGLKTIESILPYISQIPIIILTGLNDEEIPVNAVHKGIQDYLFKDQIKPDFLIRSISYAIERFKSIQALRESEERNRILFNNVSDAIIIFDINKTGDSVKISDANSITLQILNYTKEDLLSLNPDTLMDESSSFNLKKTIAEIIEKQQLLFETTLKTIDQKKIPVEINAQIFKYQNINKILWLIRDISHRKKVENEIIFEHSVMELLDNLIKIPNMKKEGQK